MTYFLSRNSILALKNVIPGPLNPRTTQLWLLNPTGHSTQGYSMHGQLNRGIPTWVTQLGGQLKHRGQGPIAQNESAKLNQKSTKNCKVHTFHFSLFR
jgi:hypothetical protein